MAVRARSAACMQPAPCRLLLLLLGIAAAAARREACDTCTGLVDRFHKGLEQTSKKNFGGGNTAWEEKTLAKYESSEIRLVEIIENLCDSSNFECNLMVEEHEEQIEKWWFKMQKKYPDLLKWLCIETLKVCCPAGTYGPDCLACMGGSERPCHGNGFCSGDGTRGGDGTCSCNAEYREPFCLECADGYYNSERNDTHSVCTVCHKACKTCNGGTNKDCKECNEGWWKEEESCVECDKSCSKCTGHETCTECSSGFVLEDDKCTDINECESLEKICVRENEICVNSPGTFICVCAEGFKKEDGECVAVNNADEETENVSFDAAQDSAGVHEDL